VIRFPTKDRLVPTFSALLRLFIALVIFGFLAILSNVTHAGPAPAGASLRLAASASYVPFGISQTEVTTSNTVVAEVLEVEALILTQSQVLTRSPGSLVVLSHSLINAGNTTSSYSFGLTTNGSTCEGSTATIQSLRLVRDNNNSGTIDEGDSPVPTGIASSITLAPSRSIAVLIEGKVPLASSGLACVSLTATTTLQKIAATNQDTVIIGNSAVLLLSKTASHDGTIIPGLSPIVFKVVATNIGSQDASPSSKLAPTGRTLVVNGAPSALILLSDVIPIGTQYVPGSLQTTAANAVRLYRRPGDPEFSYQTGEDPNAVEVGIGISTAIHPNASVAMQFSVKVSAGQVADIRNVAEAFYDDGLMSVETPSNAVVIPYISASLGLAKMARGPFVNQSANGTVNYHFEIKLKNYGASWLYGVQALDLLEGSNKFGNYVASEIPGANEYTIVAGSIGMVSHLNGRISGTAVSANPLFTGTAAASNLLAHDAVLPVGAEVTVQFDIRVNVTGKSTPLLNTSRGAASVFPGAVSTVFDESVDGNNPDADGDGNPNNDSSSTSVETLVPALVFFKNASLPRRVGEGIYEVDYVLKISNNGTAPAPNVRLLDNLNCTFDLDKADGAIASWEIISAPLARNGNLTIAGAFTGRATCNRAANDSTDPFNFPTEVPLSITSGNRPLMPGATEEVTFTVRASLKTGQTAMRALVTNKAWAVSYLQNTVSPSSVNTVAASASSVQTLLIDPEGIVYNAINREPVASAVVTFTRQSCTNGPVGPITAAQLFAGVSGAYTFNTNGSVSMTTGPDGAYRFFLQSPPLTGFCNYAIAVLPPAGSAYVAPSQLIPPTAGVFSTCGPVVGNSGAPRGSDSTTYYNNIVSGALVNTPACEVLHNHIPLDPGNILGLMLRKEGSKRQAELGDFIDYAITVTNKTGAAITGVNVNDSLPPGFAYVAGSARINGVATSNPAGGAGPQLLFSYPAMVVPIDGAAVFRYRVRIGVGAPTNGDAINRAQAYSGPLKSNSANWTVRISGGVFSDEAFVFGKVYMDCRRDGQQQGVDEVGVPGVRLYLENGTFVVTDVEGKWSLYGLKPTTHVLRLDQTTLPPGAVLGALDNRNAGNPASRFVDLVKGEFHKSNFVISNCDDKAVVANVVSRRAAIAARPDMDGEARMRSRLDPEGRPTVLGELRSLPASGQSSFNGSVGQLPSTTTPLIVLPSGNTARAGSFVDAAGGGSGGTLGVVSGLTNTAAGSLFLSAATSASNGQSSKAGGSLTNGSGAIDLPADGKNDSALSPPGGALPAGILSSSVALETRMNNMQDNKLDFVDLKTGDTTPGQSINVSVKGSLDSELRLSVNGQLVPEKRIGKKATLVGKKLAAWEYIGINLKPGANELKLEAADSFGNVREPAQQIIVVAPDSIGAIKIEAPRSARADLATPIILTVRLTDLSGVPVTARTQLTLESDRGRWLDEDLNSNEAGVQVFMEGGKAEFHLLPPGEPGNARVRISAASLVQEVGIALLPELRPMLGVGIVEGVLDLTNRGRLPLGAMPAGAAFESELSKFGGGGASRAGGRAAFFFKGAIKGDYLLTAALDTDKSQKDRLFRDIRPDEFYPIYGDSAVKGFDAQSTQKLYVRIDKDRSYLLYGDFTTASSTEVRSLSQSNRTLTGLKQVYEDQDVRVTSFVSSTSQSQQIEEFRALGTSGPYYLDANGGEFVDNSEQIEILVRDRNQPNVVLQRTPVVRLVDYVVESLTRRILFTHPISSVDANLNPQSIRVTYEVDSGGAKFVVAGTDAQFKLSEKLQLGVVANTDRNTINQRDLVALTALARVGDKTSIASEWVQTSSDLNGKGQGGRVEIRRQDEKLAIVGLATKTTSGFDNPGASFTAGHVDLSARGEYKIDATTALRGEALYSKDELQVQERKGATLSVQKKLNDAVTVEVGLRRGQSNSAIGATAGFDYGRISTSNSSLGNSVAAANTTSLGAAATAGANNVNDLTTVRARVSAQVPGLAGAQAFVEAEQDLSGSDRHTVAVGANYALTDKTRAYGRYELISSLYGPYSLGNTQSNNTGIVGIESAYMEGGRVYNEYRLADSIDGRSTVGAIGVRNTFQVAPRIRLTGGIEHTRNLSGFSNSKNNATGFSGSLGESTAITGGIEYLNEKIKASAVLEARDGSDAATRLFSAGAGYKVNPEFSVLARSVVSDSAGSGSNAGNERQLQRHQIGVAYRPVETDTWNALARYEHKTEKVLGKGTSAGAAIGGGSVFGNSSGNASLPGTYTTDVVSAHLNFNPERGTAVTSRFAAKVSKADDGVLSSSYWAQLIQGRITRDITKDWDIGLQAGFLYGQGGALKKTLGGEVGYQVYRDIWVSGGYNFVGLTDHDLAANEYTSKGAYMRLRMKFDETALGFPASGSGNTSGTGTTVGGGSVSSHVVPASRVREHDAPELAMAKGLVVTPPGPVPAVLLPVLALPAAPASGAAAPVM
jgi:uncharacterized repeat protein (TIGR01451 family)